MKIICLALLGGFSYKQDFKKNKLIKKPIEEEEKRKKIIKEKF